MDADAEAQSEAIQQFCALTGASPHEAEHYLAGFAGDLDRAVNFFFENPPSAGGGGAHLDDRGDAPGPVDMTEEDARLAQALMDEENARAGARGQMRNARAGEPCAARQQTSRAPLVPQLPWRAAQLRHPALSFCSPRRHPSGAPKRSPRTSVLSRWLT